MPNIQTTDAKGIFTKKLVASYKERISPPEFLETFFPTGAGDITDTLELSVEVQRTTERVAIDVVRGADGNRNEFTRSSEKIFISPYFREYFDQNHMTAYEMAFRGDTISGNALGRLINSAVDHMKELEATIRRAYEIQRAQILDTGIMTFNKGVGSIDFKRKATSKVNLSGAGGYFSANSNVFDQFQAAGVWLRQNGKVATNTFDAIFGTTAIKDFFANTIFLGRQNLFNMSLDSISSPEKTASGGIYHGTITAGPYRINIWSYPEYYQNAAGTYVDLFNPKIVAVLPPKPMFKTAYAMTPQLLNPGQQPQIGKFILSEYTDQKLRTREFHIESAGMPIPVGVDQIYTMQAVA